MPKFFTYILLLILLSSTATDQPLSVKHGKLEGEYSENQAQVIVDYQVAHPEQDNTIYLFLCKEGSNSAVKGHTPVNRSYGFLFGENIDKRTIAHEVGHGYPLALDHPFTTGGPTGTYSNVMDYASGTNLRYLQWGGAHNPKLKVRFGQDARKGKIMKSGEKLSTVSKKGMLACIVAYARLRENLKASRTVLKTAEARKFMNNYEDFIDDCKKNWKQWYGVDFPINFERGYFTDVDEFADHLRWDVNLTAAFKNEIKTNANLASLFSDVNNTEWSQYAEAWRILSPDKSMRGDMDDLNAVLKHLRETPNVKTDDLVSSFASALNKRAWLNGLGTTVQTFTDDVNDFVFTLGKSEDLANVKSWLGKVDDGKTYLAVHGGGNEFLVLHNGTTVTLTHRSLARWIAENKSIAKNSEVVLLSCANGTVAQNLANKLKGDYKITSWDGKVKVYERVLIMLMLHLSL